MQSTVKKITGQQEKEKFEALFQFASMGILVANEKGEILLVNNSIITVYNLPTRSFTVAVYNLSGRLRSTSVDISNLRSGYYIAKVTANGIVYSQKIYKK